MGRWTTGVETIGASLQVSIKAFTQHIKDRVTYIQGSFEYGSGASIGVELRKRFDQYEVVLSYVKTVEGEKQCINYTVRLETVASNLGKGEIYYFICPFTFQRCKVLYMAYGSLYFKSRKAYRYRIYYASQLSSRLDKHNDKYWNLERKLQKIYPKHPKKHYRGWETRPQKRIKKMEQKMDFHDEMRFRILPVSLMKAGIQF